GNTGGTAEARLRPASRKRRDERAFSFGRREMATATDLKGLADRAVKEISSAADEAALEAVRVRYLSRKDGRITAATKEIATRPIDASACVRTPHRCRSA